MKQAFLPLIFLLMTTTVNSQAWVNTTLYPFTEKYLQLASGKMHYVDEGDGEVLLFVHGTPTWSFLYRDLIKELSKEYRCIAIDHLGFGLSEKKESFPGTPEWHAENLHAFMNALDLTDITLVVHDFGGPIGLAAGIQNEERIKQVVLFNSWLWETKNDPEAQRIDKIVNSSMGKFLYLRLNISPRIILKKGFSNRHNLTKSIHEQYLKPFPGRVSRSSLLKLGQSLVGSSDWYQQQWTSLGKIASKPWLIIWGTEDAFISMKYLQKWEQRLPHAEVMKLDCGHFIQEEKTDESIAAILAFMKK